MPYCGKAELEMERDSVALGELELESVSVRGRESRRARNALVGQAVTGGRVLDGPKHNNQSRGE